MFWSWLDTADGKATIQKLFLQIPIQWLVVASKQAKARDKIAEGVDQYRGKEYNEWKGAKHHGDK